MKNGVLQLSPADSSGPSHQRPGLYHCLVQEYLRILGIEGDDLLCLGAHIHHLIQLLLGLYAGRCGGPVRHVYIIYLRLLPGSRNCWLCWLLLKIGHPLNALSRAI